MDVSVVSDTRLMNKDRSHGTAGRVVFLSCEGHYILLDTNVHCLTLKVPLGRKFIGLFRPNSVAEYRVLFIFLQKTEQQTFHPNIF